MLLQIFVLLPAFTIACYIYSCLRPGSRGHHNNDLLIRFRGHFASISMGTGQAGLHSNGFSGQSVNSFIVASLCAILRLPIASRSSPWHGRADHLEPCQSSIWLNANIRYRYMTISASWIFDIEAQMLCFDIGYDIDLRYRRIYSDIEYSNIRYWSTQKWKMADLCYMWTTQYRRIFDIKRIFFDFRQLHIDDSSI